MNRKEAQRVLERHFPHRWGKGDHQLFYHGDSLVYGLAAAGRSNQKDLPRSEAKKILKLVGAIAP